MNEEFLHYLWKFRLLDPDLMTESGEVLVVLHPGEHNSDGGPDFFNSRVRIDGTTWAGNVEIHVNASDWYRHRHEKDPAYDNVILHAVYEKDAVVTRHAGDEVPTLVIRGHFPEYIYDRYRDFTENMRWIPCQGVIDGADPFIFEQWIPALAVERLEEKLASIKRSLEACSYDWDETFYRNLARAFGFRINAQPFELLAGSLPWKILQKHRDNQFQMEALLFGQAGMLGTEFSEEYPRLLQQEYRFLAGKYDLKCIPVSVWKFLRLRPSNFPTVRIAQFASLVHSSADLFSAVLECKDPVSITRLFAVNASEYWDSHFLFGRISASRKKLMGASSIGLLIINLVAPFLFLYGEVKALPHYKEKGLNFQELLPAEMNAGIERWKEMGIPAPDALHTQALLHLKSHYCDKKRCLECRVGNQLLSR
ncbi:MAG: DUF2851 family protein [Bacteroidetes bacterium]|nr:DUF2851 family protein [Bacteroidota bacterium]